MRTTLTIDDEFFDKALWLAEPGTERSELFKQCFKAFIHAAGHMAISTITLAELLHGAEKSNEPARSLSTIEDFCSRLEILPYGPKAAQYYGSIRAALERQGQTIGVDDLHIAAHARSEGLTLVSINMREFRRVDAMQLANWVFQG